MRESDRAGVIGQVAEKRLRQSEAAKRLGLSVRQVKRLLARYRERGPSGLVSGRRGKPSNSATAEAARREAMELVRERYPDFGPTFAREKLVEEHGHRLSVETLRQWLIADGLWRAKARRAMRVHQSRPRRECVGDLVQIDGSPHAWFEDRGPGCVLIVYVDDATTRLLATGFFAEETTAAYMETTRAHLAAHGRPVAYYSDRHSVFRVNKKDREDELTQFSRALRTLDIAAIHARSPQAKGRVERANKTLQDRLVKEMRLRGINGLEAGNAYLPEFMADFNRRFAVAPRNPEDAHRAVLRDAAELDLIFCEHHRRKLTKNPTIRFECREYPVTGQGQGVSPARRGGDGRARPSTARRRCCAKGASCRCGCWPEGRGADSGGGRKDRARARRRGEGGAAGAAGPQAAAGPSLAATVQARRERGGRRMKPRAPADAPWICGRVPRTGARPSGRVDSPWTTRSAESPSTGRFRRALPTGCPHSRASRPQPHSSSNKFFLLEEEKSPNCKRGHFNFGLTQPLRRLLGASSAQHLTARHKSGLHPELTGRNGNLPEQLRDRAQGGLMRTKLTVCLSRSTSSMAWPAACTECLTSLTHQLLDSLAALGNLSWISAST